MVSHGSLFSVLASCVAALILAAPLAGRADDAQTWEAIETQFHDLPMVARRLTGPLFWLHGDESADKLRLYVEKVAEGGNGCFTAESRPHSDWLGEGWYRDLAICLDEAKRHDLKMWIFDEAWWPSGEVGGRVPAEHASKRMVVATTSVDGPKRVAPAVDRDHLIAVLAGKVAEHGIEGSSLVDLTEAARDEAFAWNAPEGRWEVLVFTWDLAEKRGANYLVDGASQDAVDWYVQTVYQPHYDRFSDDFGKSIAGFFYDEPETYGDWGTEVIPMLDERGTDWKRALVAWKKKLADPEEQAAAKYAYHDALAEAWGRTLYGGITRWCEEHGVKSIGHWLEHRNCYLEQHVCAGNMFQVQKYTSMGGIDAVFDQFVMGQRVARDAPCWQTPKLGSSITHAYGKPDDVSMVEIYGARGQDLTYPEMKWWADHMHVSGISFLIPHSFNPRAPYDRDCPPYFYNNGFEPRWPLYRVFADYTSRLSVVLTGGRHVCPVALLFLGQSAHVGKAVTPEQMSEVLEDALYDCDWLPYEVFENDMRVDGSTLRLRDEAYRVLIVPPVEVIPYATIEKAKAFFDAGGVVVGHGFLPSKSATPDRTAADVAAVRAAVWGDAGPGLGVCKTNAAGGRSYLLPKAPTPEALQKVLAGDANVHATIEVLEGETSHWLHVLHRVKAGRDVFFICNQNHTGEARAFRFRVTAGGEPECWDPMRNTIAPVAYSRVDDRTVDIDITFEPLESVLLVFRQEPALRGGAGDAVGEPIVVARVPWEGPEQAFPLPKDEKGAVSLAGCRWVWLPEGDPVQAADPGTRYFRHVVTVPAGRTIAEAKVRMAADNTFELYVNGHKAASGSDWNRTALTDVKDLLRAGDNVLAVRAVNSSDHPNPAGLIGRYVVTLDDGTIIDGAVDQTWKAFKDEASGWDAVGFDDAAWVAAKEIVAFGGGPWGAVDRPMLTLSPVQGDPFAGRFSLPSEWFDEDLRVWIEADGIEPEAAAAVTLNGAYAGGFIGKPFRLDVTSAARAGENAIEIQPFAPQAVRMVCRRAHVGAD